MHIPRPPGNQSRRFPHPASGEAGWDPLRYGGYAWPPSLPGQRPRSEAAGEVFVSLRQWRWGDAQRRPCGSGDMYLRYVSPFFKTHPDISQNCGVEYYATILPVASWNPLPAAPTIPSPPLSRSRLWASPLHYCLEKKGDMYRFERRGSCPPPSFPPSLVKKKIHTWRLALSLAQSPDKIGQSESAAAIPRTPINK